MKKSTDCMVWGMIILAISILGFAVCFSTLRSLTIVEREPRNTEERIELMVVSFSLLYIGLGWAMMLVFVSLGIPAAIILFIGAILWRKEEALEAKKQNL